MKADPMHHYQHRFRSLISTVCVAIGLFCSSRGEADFKLNFSLNLQSQDANEAVFGIVGAYDVTSPSVGTGTFIDQVLVSVTSAPTALRQPGPAVFSRFTYDPNGGSWSGALDPDTGQGAISTVTSPLQPNTSQNLGLMRVNLTGVDPGTYTFSLFENNVTDGLGNFGNGPEGLVADSVGLVLSGNASFTVTAVPEPSSLLLLASSIPAIRFLSKRRRRS